MLRIAIIAVIFGILAGGVGALLAFNYLSDYLSSLISPEAAPVVSPTARVVSPGTVESAVELAREKVVPALATFYVAKAGEAPAESVYFETDILGYGVVFTSDGWLIAHGGIFDAHSFSRVRAGVNHEVYEIDKVLIDEITGAAFIKISAENLPVVQLVNEQYVESGDRLVVVGGRDNFLATNLVSKYYNPVAAENYLESSEIVGGRLLLAGGDMIGAPMINYNAEVVGLIWEESDDGTLGLPLNVLKPLMKSLLKEGALVRPYFGVHYLDLARLAGLGEEISQGREEGAILWSGPGEAAAAVIADSPADGAEMQKGDIILSVNDLTLNSHGSLSEILLDYSPGDRLNLEILREGETMMINLTLGSYILE